MSMLLAGAIMANAGSGGPFSPDDIASLFRWYDADSLGLSDNDPVSSWTDLSTNADHAVQATGSKQPVFKTGIVGGYPVVRFITDDVLEFSEIFDSSGSNGTIFVVGKMRTSGATLGTFLSTRQSAVANGWGFRGSSTSSTLYFHTSFSPNITLTHTDQFNLLEIKRSGLSITSYVNGSASGSGTISGFTTSGYNKTSIGAENSGTSSFLDGDIAEIIIYNTALSDADRGNVETYLLNKYGI